MPRKKKENLFEKATESLKKMGEKGGETVKKAVKHKKMSHKKSSKK